MQYSGPLLGKGVPLDDAAAMALAGDAAVVAGALLYDGAAVERAEQAEDAYARLLGPVVPVPFANAEALRLFPEHFLIAGLMLVSFAGGLAALLR